MKVKRNTFTQSNTYTHIQHMGIHKDIRIYSQKHTTSHVRKAHTDEKLSVYTEDIGEGGIRFFLSLGIKAAS